MAELILEIVLRGSGDVRFLGSVRVDWKARAEYLRLYSPPGSSLENFNDYLAICMAANKVPRSIAEFLVT
jgi:hypothetical protein